MTVAMVRYFTHGWIETFFVRPTYFFTYEGFEWVRPWPAPGMTLHFAALGALAFATCIGFHPRLAVALFGLGFTWAHLIDKTNYLNHYYLVSLLAGLLACCPLGAAFAVDAWRARARRPVTPAWTVWALRAQIGLVYVFGGVAKLNADWLLHAQPLRLWLAASVDVPVVGPLLEHPWAAYAASWAGALFDLGIVPLLLIRRTRPFAYALVLVFHLLTSELFPIGIFPWLMMAATPIFFAPSWPRILATRVATAFGHRDLAAATDPTIPSASASPPRPWSRREVALVLALVLWFGVQIGVPLRGLAYAGNGYWTEEGFRFAWKVMVMEKSGDVTFRVRDAATGAVHRVDPRELLTPLQVRMMATQPDMIRQFARAIADDERAHGRPVEVRADAFVSFNGRPSRRFVDPDVDLAANDVPRFVLPFE